MPSLTKEHVIQALRSVADPAGGGDIVTTGAVRSAAACDGFVSATIACSRDEAVRARIRAQADAAIRRAAAHAFAPVTRITIDWADSGAPAGNAHSPAPAPAPGGAARAPVGLPGVKHVIAVGAGKGGVGKSTISVNLAVALAREGHAVALLDGDIYGPSVPTLMGLGPLEVLMHRGMLQPFFVHGVKTMTLGKLVDAEKPLIWRGPMAHGAFKQLVEQTEWGNLDYLIIDLPPGTGDVPLTMAQVLSLTGAVVVCTPQKVAQDDAVRAARMFQTLNIPVLGVVENMSYFIGDDGKEYDLFGKGGAEAMASRLGLPFLGAVPIVTSLRVNSDAGTPVKNFEGAGAQGGVGAAFERLAARVEQEAAIATMAGAKGPRLTVT